MPDVVRITLALLCFLWSWSHVQAWVTEEHILIGEAGYQLACEGFRDPYVARTAAQRRRAQLFCFQDPALARHYGELTAYGGDYAAEPEDIPSDFETMSAQLANLSDWSNIQNLLHRAKLALEVVLNSKRSRAPVDCRPGSANGCCSLLHLERGHTPRGPQADRMRCAHPLPETCWDVYGLGLQRCEVRFSVVYTPVET